MNSHLVVMGPSKRLYYSIYIHMCGLFQGRISLIFVSDSGTLLKPEQECVDACDLCQGGRLSSRLGQCSCIAIALVR